MSGHAVDAVARAVLYEGYNLYPYRRSSVKNQRRFNFGVLSPRDYAAAAGGAEAWSLRAEVLATGGPETTVDARVRFLHLLERQVTGPDRPVAWLEVGGRLVQSWEEAVERDVLLPGLSLEALAGSPRRAAFAFEGLREAEPLCEPDGRLAGSVVRQQLGIEGVVEAAAERAGDGMWRVSVLVSNETPFERPGDREGAMLRSLVSAHVVLEVRGGEFVSLLDPPEEMREAAAACRNAGVWPVLVGEEGARDVVLASPIILYDYPKVAPESAGDLFDATEIDEILTLRIMTLTDEEKREMRDLDDRTRRLLERTETLPAEQLMKLHGAMRDPRPDERDEP